MTRINLIKIPNDGYVVKIIRQSFTFELFTVNITDENGTRNEH